MTKSRRYCCFSMAVLIPAFIISIVSFVVEPTTASASEVRQYQGLGVRIQGQSLRRKKGWFQAEWNKTLGQLVSASDCAFDDHHPTIKIAFRWSETYVNQNIKPTRSQARDPNWSNYIWNQNDKNSAYAADGVSDALSSSLVANGKGRAKLALLVGLTSTGTRLAPPAWLRKDSSLAWMEGTNSNKSTENWHLRFDNPVAVQHAADFMEAVVKKYGDNKGIHSIGFNEYFLGQAKYRPSGISQKAYFAGVVNMWKKVIAAAPKDSSGKRVNIVQTHPLGVSLSEIESIGLAVTESDALLEMPLKSGSLSSKLKDLSARGKVHTMINGDARFATGACRVGKAHTQRWDGTANPFGHKNGYSGVATPHEILWYHSSKGPVPVHSITLTLDNSCGPQNLANFKSALKTFGSCGSKAAKWGEAPAPAPASWRKAAKIKIPPKIPLLLVE